MTGITHTLITIGCLALFFYVGMFWGYFKGLIRGQYAMIEKLVDVNLLTVSDVEKFNELMKEELDKDE